jgi:hypothetical protein
MQGGKHMLLQKKALYNLIQLNANRIEAGDLKIRDLQEWQIADYRLKSTENLFQQLLALGITLTETEFLALGKTCEAPEEIVELLAEKRMPLEKDEIFLVVFELWRRFFPEKRTLSIFCDELDYQMVAFDLNKPNEISDTLAYFQQLLDENVDRGINPYQAFQLIQMYCANDIESFLFDYILAEIESENHCYAAELLDGFSRYIRHSLWFDYLAARAEILKDPEDGYDNLEKMIEKINHETSIELVEEILFFLAPSGNHSLFYILAKKALEMLKSEADLKEFLEATYAHYDYLELKVPALAIAALFYGRETIPVDAQLTRDDPGLIEISNILNQRVHFAEE